ncbi:glutamate synthase subunit beta [Kiritimatiella glycovorans]|uniref:Glutamate synthase [NADPH] small chain n=1 Tax=Kiritimatiella glycovorans TaxID=1307763 RepID=A0A0G3EDI6_9BACT|nr:glutamate synthase subunit beta [Kiritimatiella glycovorans]AKJ64541.1 Glutamate synthase [NADPH] small chain [Kiritimatiella glycovorans]
MDKNRGFIKYRRREPGYRPIEERVRDFRAVERRLDPEEVRRQSARCMDCGVPFCHAHGCPVGNVIPEFNEHVFHGRWRDALEILLSTNPFPEFTGRICPAPCETSCVLGINADPVTIRQMELEIVERGFEEGFFPNRPPENRRDQTVAVVGSGPAGLSAAYELNRVGFRVTVFDSAPRPGGLLRYGIPDFKMEKWIIDRRVEVMEREGIVFECGVEIGSDLSFRFLRRRYDAVVLTGGAREPRDLEVPGRELDGIHFAMDFLSCQNLLNEGEPVREDRRVHAEGRHVVVIGGGDTGADCVGTANRQGAESVTQLEILPEPPKERPGDTPWPLWPRSLRTSSSHKEGCERRWSVMTKSFEGDAENRVRQLNCVRVEWVEPEEGGRPVPREVAGSEFTLQADLVLLAMGFVKPAPSNYMYDLDLRIDERGRVARDERHRTSLEGVFVAGDMALGASLVVSAIRDGQDAAEGVRAWIDGETKGIGEA